MAGREVIHAIYHPSLAWATIVLWYFTTNSDLVALVGQRICLIGELTGLLKNWQLLEIDSG